MKKLEWFEKLEGLSWREGRKLRSLSKKNRIKGSIVEIGSWKGKSTIYLALGSKEGIKNKVMAIDPHVGSEEHKKQYGKVWTFEEFKANIKRAKADKLVVPVLKLSKDAVKSIRGKISFVYIDGAHDYKSVKSDFETWFPKLENGGIIALHDTILWDGPKKLVKEKFIGSPRFKDVGFINSMTYATKVKKNTALDRAKTKLVLTTKDTYELLYSTYSKIRY